MAAPLKRRGSIILRSIRGRSDAKTKEVLQKKYVEDVL